MTADVKMLLSREDDLDDLDYLVPVLRAKTTQRKVAKRETMWDFATKWYFIATQTQTGDDISVH